MIANCFDHVKTTMYFFEATEESTINGNSLGIRVNEKQKISILPAS